MTTPATHLPAVRAQQAAEVWSRTRTRHFERVEVLERAVLALMDGNLSEELRESAETEAHALASTVGTFGLRAGSRIARALQQSFGAKHTLGRPLAARLADQILALRRELERTSVPALVSPGGVEMPRVLLLSDGARTDALVSEGLAAGLEVVVRPLLAGIDVVTQEVPDAVIVEVGDGSVDGVIFLLELLGRRSSGPILVISPNDGMDIRLAIGRAGACGPLLPGLPPLLVIERTAALLASRNQQPSTVLVVDSDVFSLQLAQLVLEQAGHTVHGLEDPTRFWETLDSVSPDLVLSGVQMTGASGMDLCRALRADPRWRELPMVFMAAAAESEQTRHAYRVGADDVLRKPLAREDLLSRIDNRLRRTRLSRRASDADALTGLSSRHKAEHDIERLLQIARRHRQQITLVRMRLDLYEETLRQVGQAALDVGVRSFAHLLTQSFRTEDVIAQWGPNEFVMALYDANSVNASTRVREVMEDLRSRTFAAPSGLRFSLTCSAGMATYPEDASDLRELYAEADGALVLAGGLDVHEVLGIAGDPNARTTGRADVLIVDDDPSIATLLMHALESRQFQVTWLRSGAEAARVLLGEKPELRARLILLEVNLPELDGLALLRSLAAENILRHSRVIVLSSRTTEAETVQAFELGAVDYVAKPFSVAVLTERIRKAMRV